MKKFAPIAISAAAALALVALTGCAGGPSSQTHATEGKPSAGPATDETKVAPSPPKTPNQKLTAEQIAAKLKVGMDFSEIESLLPPARNVAMSANGERIFFYNWGTDIPSSGSLVAEAAINAIPFAGLFTGPADLRKARARQAAYRSLTVRVRDGKVVDYQFSPPLRVAQSPETSGQAVAATSR